MNMSGYIILDPLSGETVSGSTLTAGALALSGPSFNVPQPGDGGSYDSSNNSLPEPQTGFYRVFHIPDFPASITNYTFNGPTFIRADFAAPDAPVDNVDSATVLINGQPTDYALLMPYVNGNGVTNWGMGIYFDRMPNGTNTIQLLTTVRESDTLNDQTPYMVFSNAPTIITIGNLITFTNWDDLIWNNTNCTFRAQTVPNVDWEIDIYDVYDNFVNYQTGHSSDGNITWTWNLYDYWGNLRNNSDADPVFYPYITVTGNLAMSAQPTGVRANDTSSSGKWTPPNAASFPSIGSWLIAYMDNFYADAGTNYSGWDSYYKEIMNQMAGGPELWNISATSFPIKFGNTYTQADRDGSWASLANLLANPQYRNFYYFGHGAPNDIGGDVTTFDSDGFPTGSHELAGSKAKLTSEYVRDNITLHNPLGVCFYRFVFMDGCNTANGDWPDAWGMPNQSKTLDYYTSASSNPTHARPSAFVGWNTSPGGKNWGTIDHSIWFRSAWMANWSVNNGNYQDQLDENLDSASDASSWPPGRLGQLHSALQIYGYRTLKFNEYNHKGDWP
jgi:hypothetical protein